MIVQTHLKGAPTCPVCLSVLDGAAGTRRPAPGDLSVCTRCLALIAFTEAADGGLGLRALDDDEFASLPAHVQAALAQAQLVIQREAPRRQGGMPA